MISGSASGVSTLADGSYSIQVAPGTTLTFQYIGYKAVEYTVPDGRTQVTCNLEMQSDTQALEDVVVIAYGVRKKGTIAGSVSTVKAEKIETTPTAAFDQALQGQVPGLTVLSSSGEPSKSAELTIRGTNSINAGTDPLFVLDGIVISASDFNAINPADIDERNEQRPLNPNVYVEGMDGVITELTLTDALFEGIEALYKEVTDESGMPYTSIAINQAELMIYLEKSDYDWEKIDVGAITPLLDASFERLGLYADYKHVLGISDYYYTYERLYSSQNFQLPYGGYLNRSQGCYVMDITSHLQEVWNGYLKSQGIETGGSQTENPAPRTIYIGPEAYGLFTMPYTSAQGMENTANNAPIKLRLIYTMIK